MNHEDVRKKIRKVDVRRIETARINNRRNKKLYHNALKAFKNAVDKIAAFPALNSAVARACQKGVIHANKRDRVLSRLSKQVK